VKLGVNHEYSCCIKKIIKNKLVATRICEFGNYGKVVVMRRLNSQSGRPRNKLNNKVIATRS
jgi:hypothetical protein